MANLIDRVFAPLVHPRSLVCTFPRSEEGNKYVYDIRARGRSWSGNRMAKGPKSSLWAAGLAFVFSVVVSGGASAGPPYRTDDPETVDYQHWEFYTFTSGTHVSGNASGIGPAFEFNYGLIPNGQLHIVAPGAFDHPAGGSTQFGYGDTEIGFKYRFIEEDKQGSRPQVGIFPMLELPTGNQSRGLGAGYVRAFLPLWVQKSSGDWTTYGGGGYWINQDSNFGDKDYWFFGWLLQRKITEKLTLGGEIFHQTADTITGKDSTGFNFGGSYDFDEHNHLLFSAGRGFQNASITNLSSWYLAWQITY